MKKWIEKLKKADVPLAIAVINNHWGGFARVWSTNLEN